MTTLMHCLQNESDAMADLIEILKQEQAALSQAPSLTLMDDIKAITQRKNQQIAAISQLSQLRNTILSQLGFNSGDTTMPAWLQDQAQKDCWAQLIKHTRKAKELNRVNGLLISKHLLRNKSTLQVLYKHHRSSPMPSLYGSNGQSSTQRSVMRGFVV